MRVLRGVVYRMKSRGLRARTVYKEIIIIMCFELSIQIINGIYKIKLIYVKYLFCCTFEAIE